MQTINTAWLGKSKRALKANNGFYKGWEVDKTVLYSSQQLVLISGKPDQYCWNQIRGNIISDDLGLDIAKSGVKKFGRNKAIEKPKVLKYLLRLCYDEYRHVQSSENQSIIQLHGLKKDIRNLKYQNHQLQCKVNQLKRDKNEEEIWLISTISKEIKDKLKGATSRATSIKVKRKVSPMFSKKYFLNYNNKKMKAPERPIKIIAISKHEWTTKDRIINKRGYLPKSFIIHVYNAGQSFDYYCPTRGLWMNFGSPNMSYNTNTETLSFEAIKLCATAMNYKENKWQRYQ